MRGKKNTGRFSRNHPDHAVFAKHYGKRQRAAQRLREQQLADQSQLSVEEARRADVIKSTQHAAMDVHNEKMMTERQDGLFGVLANNCLGNKTNSQILAWAVTYFTDVAISTADLQAHPPLAALLGEMAALVSDAAKQSDGPQLDLTLDKLERVFIDNVLLPEDFLQNAIIVVDNARLEAEDLQMSATTFDPTNTITDPAQALAEAADSPIPGAAAFHSDSVRQEQPAPQLALFHNNAHPPTAPDTSMANRADLTADPSAEDYETARGTSAAPNTSMVNPFDANAGADLTTDPFAEPELTGVPHQHPTPRHPLLLSACALTRQVALLQRRRRPRRRRPRIRRRRSGTRRTRRSAKKLRLLPLRRWRTSPTPPPEAAVIRDLILFFNVM